MDLHRVPRSGWLRAVVVVGILGWLAECDAGEAPAPTSKQSGETKTAAGKIRDVRSAHFLVHTDLPPGEANELMERLETMLRLISTYWGRPMRGVIECYVVRSLDEFPVATMARIGIRQVQDGRGRDPDETRRRRKAEVGQGGRLCL